MRNSQNTRLVGGDRTSVSGDDGRARQVVHRGDADSDGLSLSRVQKAVVNLVGDLGVVAVGVVVLIETRSEAKSREQSANRVPVNTVELERTGRERTNDGSDGDFVARQVSQNGSSGQLQSSNDSLQLIEFDVTTTQPNLNGLSKIGVSGTVVFQESAVREARNSSEVVVGQISVLDDDRGVIDSADEDLDGLGPRSQLGASVLVARVVLAASSLLYVVSEERLSEQDFRFLLSVGVSPREVDGLVANDGLVESNFNSVGTITSGDGRGVLVQLAANLSGARGQNVVGESSNDSDGIITFTIEVVESQDNSGIFITDRSSHLSPRSVIDTNNVNADSNVSRGSAGVTNTVNEVSELFVTNGRSIRRSKEDNTTLRVANEDGARSGGDAVGFLGTSNVELVESTLGRLGNNLSQDGVDTVGGKTSQTEDGTVELVVIVPVVFSELDVLDGGKRRVVQDIGDGGSTEARSDQLGGQSLSRVGLEGNAEASTHVRGKTSNTLTEAANNVTLRSKIGDQRDLRGGQVDSLGDGEGQITAVGLDGDDKTEAQSGYNVIPIS